MNRRIIYILINVILICCKSENNDSFYQLVYKNDKNGNALKGSKQELIKFIRGGADIKIGWGTKGKNHSIEHLSEPIWIAILDEEEVIAHPHPQVLSKIDWNSLTANYSDSVLLNQEWRVVITTKGEFDAIWYNIENRTILKRIPQNHNISWFVKGSNSNKPLFSNEK